MPLSLHEVEHIASLARLELNAEEKQRYRQQLSAILDHIARLQNLDTTTSSSGISEPVAGMSGTENALRSDEPRPPLPPEILLKSAAQTERSQFKIPPVFE